MQSTRQPNIRVFVDDGHPESRDYASNYVSLAPGSSRAEVARLLSRPPARPDAVPPPMRDRNSPADSDDA